MIYSDQTVKIRFILKESENSLILYLNFVGQGVKTIPKSAVPHVQVANQGQKIVQAAPGKNNPQEASIFKMVKTQRKSGNWQKQLYLGRIICDVNVENIFPHLLSI